MADDRQLKLKLQKQINVCNVLISELTSLQPGRSVYSSKGSGLVLYRSDPSQILHREKGKRIRLQKQYDKIKDIT